MSSCFNPSVRSAIRVAKDSDEDANVAAAHTASARSTSSSRVQVMESRAEDIPCGNFDANILRLVRSADSRERVGIGKVEFLAQLGPFQRLRVLGDLEQVVNDLVARQGRNVRSD